MAKIITWSQLGIDIIANPGPEKKAAIIGQLFLRISWAQGAVPKMWVFDLEIPLL